MIELLPQPSELSYPSLELYDDSDNLLRSDYVLPPVANSKRVRNVQPMQPAGANVQSYKGDGVFILDEVHARVVLILSAGSTRAEAEHQYEQDALQTVKLKIGNYSQPIATYKGIDHVDAVAQLNKTYYTLEWIFIPKVYYWIDESAAVTGQSASQTGYIVSALYNIGSNSWTATFSSNDVGKIIEWSNGVQAKITGINDSHNIVVDRPQTVTIMNFTLYDAVSRVL